MLKFNANLDDVIVGEAETLLQEYKDMFAWSYKELIKNPPHIIQHWIELDTTIPRFIKWILTMSMWLNKIWINY